MIIIQPAIHRLHKIVINARIINHIRHVLRARVPVHQRRVEGHAVVHGGELADLAEDSLGAAERGVVVGVVRVGVGEEGEGVELPALQRRGC